jgi:16S rRNA (cytosine967-C5)-methyltransferase
MPVSAGSAPLILDACAGPGGKSTHLAQLGARVVATDIRPGRARMVADAAQQLAAGADGDRVHVVVADALRPAVAAGLFDAVLVDAPCTGLGVLRRRPELRWRRDAADPDRLATVQAALLEAAIELVRPGGRLVYSVCTWPEVETVGVVQRLIAVAGDRVQVEDAAILLGRSGDEGSLGAGVQLAPDRDDTDGMYVSVLRRTA